MSLTSSTGIVLSASVMGEADVRVTVFTRESGKKGFIFKGLKKSSKRPQSASEPGTVINIIYNERENRDLIVAREFSVIRYFHPIRENLDRIMHCSYILELTERTSGFSGDGSQMFDLLAGGLLALSGTSYPVNLSVFFTVHLIRLNGIMPEVTRCSRCGSSVFSRFSFNPADLGIVCENCAGSGRRMLDIRVRDMITEFLNNKFSAIDHAAYPEEISLDLLFHLSMFMEQYFSIEMKSRDFVIRRQSGSEPV
jgi:DNA repair protein RecO (recombination protein O)